MTVSSSIVTETVLEPVHQAMTSPWIYLILFTLAALDGFVPAFPSESVVITAGVFAATGEPDLLAVIVVSALGAFAGDHASYLIGRTAGARLLSRTPPGSHRRAALDRAGTTLADRGGLVLVIARYIPGGRTATTITMGTVGYPLRTFSFFDTIAAASWGTYSALLGYVGGMTFEQDPVKGLLLGLGLAITAAVLVETIRHLRRRCRTPPTRDVRAGEEREEDVLAAHRPAPSTHS